MKIAVMTDSTSYLSQDLIDKYDIPVAPLSVTFDDSVSYTEDVNVDIDHFTIKWLLQQRYLRLVNRL